MATDRRILAARRPLAGSVNGWLVLFCGGLTAVGVATAGTLGGLRGLPESEPKIVRLLEQVEDFSVSVDRPSGEPDVASIYRSNFGKGLSGWYHAVDERSPMGKIDGANPAVMQAAAEPGSWIRLASGNGVLARFVPVSRKQYLQVQITARVQSPQAHAKLTVIPLPRVLDPARHLQGQPLLEFVAGLQKDGSLRPGLPFWKTAELEVGDFQTLKLRRKTAFDTRALLIVFQSSCDPAEASPVDFAGISVEALPLRALLELGPESAIAAAGRPSELFEEAGLRGATSRHHPLVFSVDTLLERREGIVLPAPATAAFTVTLPAGDLVLEFGATTLFEQRSTWRRRPTTLQVVARENDGEERLLLEQRFGRDSTTAWRDSEADLSRYAGQTVSLEFRADSSGSDDLLVIGAPRVRRRAPQDPRPNVILISIDTLRADRMSAEGYPRETTPHLDRFARTNVWCRQAMSSSSYTLPAHGTLMTGQLASLHGAEDDRVGRNRLSPRRSDLLALRLREAGYLTAAFTGGVYLAPRYGFDLGFDRYNYVDSFLTEFDQRWEDHPVPDQPEFNLQHHRQHRVDGVIDWLRRHRDSRFFLFLHTYAVHNYRPSREYREAFSTSHSDLGDDLGRIRDRRRIGEPVAPEDLRHYEDLYDATLRETDAALGKLIAYLRSSRLWNHSIVVVVSDHGEEFLDHGGMVHGRKLFQEMLHVPLMIHFPEGVQKEITEPVHLADVAPTLLEALGLEPNHPVHGRSLMPLLVGDSLSGEAIHIAELGIRKNAIQYASREGELKLIEYRAETDPDAPLIRHELFNLEVDPQETVDLTTEQDITAMGGRMWRILDEARRLKASQPNLHSEQLTPEQRKRLQEIGYLGGGDEDPEKPKESEDEDEDKEPE